MKSDGLELLSSSDDVDISVIRSSDGQKSKITLPLSCTLNGLKDRINSDKILGPATRDQQRLFHLGKELKHGNQSLEQSGIGNFKVYSVHLHSLAPKTVSLLDNEDTSKAKSSRKKRKSTASSAAPANARSSNESDGGMVDLTGGGTPQQQPQRQKRKPPATNSSGVVDLLDSDSDDDEVEML
ncbi:hypothetical protein THAOC_37252 [Thalassiosira oceanica]|uniref:Uncharacterized protein n=1 Tax=Thalassiosira oceanica TaxID=159749 RepID=K0QYM5_THAOC|nr:hypothetical protein THAOC_37252 [Thalassiosira oceanica]|eukprot:EJK44228.1 hypothetical protein THAOC_37252 [Thalassiosira oceanica]